MIDVRPIEQPALAARVDLLIAKSERSGEQLLKRRQESEPRPGPLLESILERAQITDQPTVGGQQPQAAPGLCRLPQPAPQLAERVERRTAGARPWPQQGHCHQGGQEYPSQHRRHRPRDIGLADLPQRLDFALGKPFGGAVCGVEHRGHGQKMK
jgi:hypothetical protein